MTRSAPERDRTDEAAEKFARIELAVLDSRCTPLMVSVLVALSNYANHKRTAWPSYESLAFITGGALQNVRIAIERLEAIGYIIVERDDQPGRSRVNRYHLQRPRCMAPIRTLRTALEDHRTAEKEARQRARSSSEKEARGRAKQARGRALTGMLACPDPLEPSPPYDPSSDTTVSADAAASASPSREWKGSEGEPLPPDFPNDLAMADAASWAESAGVYVDLTAERSAFRNHHYSVRCRQRDWDKSWERWIEGAIQREEAAA